MLFLKQNATGQEIRFHPSETDLGSSLCVVKDFPDLPEVNIRDTHLKQK